MYKCCGIIYAPGEIDKCPTCGSLVERVKTEMEIAIEKKNKEIASHQVIQK